jgi:hypothetical protein
MSRWLLTMFACLAFAVAGRAQVFFLDEFNGSDLAPHWSRPPAGDWAHNVSGGRLNVTGLFYPSNPKSCCNGAATGTTFTGPEADFRVTAGMGWDPGTDQGISIELSGGEFHVPLVEFGYRAWGGRTPAIYAWNYRQTLELPPPPPGLYEFTIGRHGSQYEFSVDGVAIGTLTGGTANLNRIVLRFWGPARDPLGAFHVNRVEVVPTPGGLAALGMLVLGAGRRRSHRRPNDEPSASVRADRAARRSLP